MSRDFYEEFHLRRVINASGTLTTYGQSGILPAAVEAMTSVADGFFEMDQLHARASEVIARMAGSEAGFVTSCAAAGITLGIASCMTGTDVGKIAQLPDTTGMKNEVILQMGHAVNYGAPVTQGIRLAGATVKLIGTVNSTPSALFEASITEQTAAAMFVISHHTTQYGFIPLQTYVAIAHSKGVPVVVDMAAEEHMMPKIIAAGADIVIASGHKHFRAPTSGVMAGRMDLIQGAYAQNRGIGRGMKIGKEGIAGLIAALEEWERGTHQAQQAEEKKRVQRIVDRLSGLEGIQALALWPEPDPYPIARAKVVVDPEKSGLSAMALSVALAQGDPTIKTRGHHVEEGYFLLDPFNMSDADAEFICDKIIEIASKSKAEKEALVRELSGLSVADLWSRSGPWPYHSPGQSSQ